MATNEEQLNKAAAVIKRLQERIAALEGQIPTRKIKYYKREPPKEGEPIPEDVKEEFARIRKIHENDPKRNNRRTAWHSPWEL
jgi:hypothetical protein